MAKYEPDFTEGAKFINETTEERYVIVGMKYNKEWCDIEYKFQCLRHRFNMFTIPEAVVSKNLRSGEYTQYD